MCKTELFITKAKKVHGDLYNYSKVNYVNATSKVIIIDPEFGEFEQSPSTHLKGSGNKLRARRSQAEKIKGNSETFIKSAKKVHGDLYDYSKVDYVNAITKVIIIDPEFGEFEQTPHNHLSGSGCPARMGVGRITNDEYIKKASIIHNSFYDYSEVVYEKMTSRIKIICPMHGAFIQVAHSHLDGSGCKKCAVEMTNKQNTKSLEKFIVDAIEVHGELYDYSNSLYKGALEKIDIICKVHGVFSITPTSHTSSKKVGCPKCGQMNANEKNTKSIGDFISEAREIHGDLYDYSKVDYVNAITKVIIIDPEFGEFEQTPSSHLKGSGCFLRLKASLTKTKEVFIDEAREIHGDTYDYSKVEYVNALTNVIITDPIYGDFTQTPSKHLQGQGSPRRAGKDFKYNYISAIVDGDVTVAIKYGIETNLNGRTYNQNRLSKFDVVRLQTWKAIDSLACKLAEDECKKIFQVENINNNNRIGFLTSYYMEDGWTETTPTSNIDKIIAIYKKHGATLVE